MKGFIVALLACCALSGAAYGQSPVTVIWAHPPTGSYYWDVYAAEDLGYFAQEGIRVEDVNTDSPSQTMQMLVTQTVTVVSMSSEVAITAVEKGADAVVVGVENARVGWSLMVRPEIRGYADLRGKTLGVAQLKEASGTMLKLLLEKNGVKPNEYEVIPLGGTPNRYAAMLKGAIAATVLTPPTDFIAAAAGMKKLGDTFEAFAGAGVFFMVQRSWAQKYPDVITKFLRATARSALWLHDPANRARANEILMKRYKISKEDAEKNYDSVILTNILSARSNLTDATIQPWLDLRSSKDAPGRYYDATYLGRAQKR